MRGFRRFCVGIAAMALAWSSTTVQAQPEPRYYEKSATPEGGWSPNSFQPQGPYGAGGPQTAGHWTPEMMAGGVQQAQFQQGPPPPSGPGNFNGMPPGGNLNPYPGLDMYRYGFQQTTNEGGLWYKRMLNASRTYTGSIEFIVPVYDEPGGELFGYGGIDTNVVATDRIPPFYFTTPRDPGTVTTTGGQSSLQASRSFFDRYFQPRTFDQMFNDMSSSGVKIELGVETEDGSGWSVNGWYGGESNQVFQYGDDPIRSYTPVAGGDPFSFLGNDPLYLLELSALTGGLPINNGSGVADTIAFDTLFEVQYSQEAWGTGLKFYKPAISSGDGYRIRPILGLRYVNIREGYNFRGLDSGGEYEFLNFNDIDVQQEFDTLDSLGFELTTGGANTGEPGFEGRPTPDTFNDGTIEGIISTVNPQLPFPTNPYEVQVAAYNQAHAAGPEIGIEAEFGGDETQLTLTAIAGLTATKENMRLDGFGVYNHFLNSVDPDSNILTPDGGEMGTGIGGLTDEQTRFNDRASSTHVSPLLDLSVKFESRVFQYVPGLNRIEFFDEAKFSTSYGFLYVGNLSRPANSVEYVTFPINPSLDPNRAGWTMTQWTFGLTWEH
ncbi:hypothetical protein [uncultured Rubinisphaera sp.]|uniref:hypothetical protein n=2 Tax=Rubinisphaera TaxID=1649490 RepID=UPI0030DD806F